MFDPIPGPTFTLIARPVPRLMLRGTPPFIAEEDMELGKGELGEADSPEYGFVEENADVFVCCICSGCEVAKGG